MDRILEYSKAVTFDGLTHLAQHDAIREGDGLAMVEHWKHDLIPFANNNHPKYFTLAHNFLCGMTATLTIRAPIKVGLAVPIEQSQVERVMACGPMVTNTAGYFPLTSVPVVLATSDPTLAGDLPSTAQIVDKAPTSKGALRKVQDAFNEWREESGRSFTEISRVFALSIG